MGKILICIAVVLQSLTIVFLLKDQVILEQKFDALKGMFDALVRITSGMNEQQFEDYKKKIYELIENGEITIEVTDER